MARHRNGRRPYKIAVGRQPEASANGHTNVVIYTNICFTTTFKLVPFTYVCAHYIFLLLSVVVMYYSEDKGDLMLSVNVKINDSIRKTGDYFIKLFRAFLHAPVLFSFRVYLLHAQHFLIPASQITTRLKPIKCRPITHINGNRE